VSAPGGSLTWLGPLPPTEAPLDLAVTLVPAVAGFALGALASWLLALGRERAAAETAAARAQAERAPLEALAAERGRRAAELEADVARRDEALTAAAERLRDETATRAALEARLEEQRRALDEQRALLAEAERRLSDTFKALSADALQASGVSFLRLAQQALEKYQEGARGDLERRQQGIRELVDPMRQALQKLEQQVGEMERRREGAYAGLSEQVRSLGETQVQLRTEASNLVRALRAPQVRGRWGEMQLRRVVELAGMDEHCDFTEQHAVAGSEGRLRPDLVVHLPGGRTVVVDAKAPLAAYLEAVEATDEAVRSARLADHARQVRDHVVALSRKSYWDELRPTPEFVVLFLPGESFFAAALEQDRELIERGAEKNVILATPTTLVALLKAVAYGWKQEAVAANAREVAELGRDLHKRLFDMAGHLARLGKGLSGSVEAYNAFVGSLESRVLPAARRFEDLEAAGAEGPIDEIRPVEAVPRRAQAPELALAAGSGERD
jgi:DNA recombination protein RmuC